MWNRIIYLRDSSQASAKEQLGELKNYLNKINLCSYRNDSTNVLLLARIGWLYSKENDFKSAIAYTSQAIDVIHAQINDRNTKESQLIKCYNNLRILYDSTNQVFLRNKAIDSCISVVMRLKTDYNYVFELVNFKIENSFEQGDYYNCLNYSNLGEFIAGKSGYLTKDVLYYNSWKINSLIYLNQYKKASELLDKSIKDCLKTGNKNYIGSLLGLKARIAIDYGRTNEAIKYTRSSVLSDKAISNYKGCSGSLNNLGYYLYFKKLHQNEKALEAYNEALHFANDNYSVAILDNIAVVYAEMGDYNKAFEFFQKSFDKIYPGVDELSLLNKSGEDILNRVSAEYIVGLVLDKAETLIKKYEQKKDPADLQFSLHIYKSADRLMDKIRMVQTEYASKLFWRSDTRRLYEKAIVVSLLTDNKEDAFFFFEKSRAVLLNDQLKEQATGDPNIGEMASIKKKIPNLERQVSSLDPSTKEYADVQRELFTNKEQLSRLDHLIKTKNPWYYQSLLDTNFIKLKEAQNKLIDKNDSSTILEFFDGDSAVYMFSITRNHSKISIINKTSFETLVDRYNLYLTNPILENQDFNGFIKTGQDLYQIISKESPLPKGRIVISPDGRYFPFEALVTNNNVSQPAYFVNDHVVSYTYSVRFLLNEFTSKKAVSSGTFLGVAPVQFPSSFNLSPLLQSDASIKKINSHFRNADVLVSSQATRNNFMQQFQDFKIIQLYTHASDTSAYGEPVIYFSDSALYLSELIPEGKIATRLIVLSACETGNGKLYKGEGVFSFNRGFASLGIPSSVINLWSVDDESTYRLTELFYKYVNEGLALDQALQKAKLEFISSSSKEKRLPYYWAAAVLVGKSDKIEMHNGMGWRYAYFALGILFLIYLVWKLIKKNFGKVRAKQ